MEKYSNKIFILLGGEGFIGKHYQTFLRENYLDCKIISIDKKTNDDLSSNKFPLLKYNRIIEKYLKDIKSKNLIPEINILHLASTVGVRNVITNKSLMYTEMLMNFNIIDLIHNIDLKINEISKINGNENVNFNFLYFSSSEVYGDIKYMKETNHSKIKSIDVEYKRNRYGVYKLHNEFLFKEAIDELQEESKINYNYKIIRPFNVIGEGQSEEFVIPKMINDAFNEKKIYIYGDGLQKRTFIDTDDFNNALNNIILNIDSIEGNLINIANPINFFSITEIAKKIQSLISGYLSTEIDIEYKSVPENLIGQYERIPDINKLYKIYKPQNFIDKTLKELVLKKGEEYEKTRIK